MAFKYIQGTFRAEDEVTGEVVRSARVLRENIGVVLYAFESKGLTPIHFKVTNRREPDGEHPGKELVVATLVDETDVKSGFVDAHGDLSFEQRRAAYPAFRERLAQGIFEATTYGGNLLRFYPEYKVEFVPSLDRGIGDL